MEEKNLLKDVPYIVHEKAMARNDRTVKRLVAALIVVAVLWFATIAAVVWSVLWYLHQYDFESYSQEYSYAQDGEGVNIMGDYNGVDFDVAKDNG